MQRLARPPTPLNGRLNDNWDKIDNAIGTLLVSTMDRLRPIGQPVFRLDNTLFDDEVRLEGGKVRRSDYPNLVRIYGNTYAPAGATDTGTYLYLPNFLNRVIQGSNSFGYIEAGLPNITGEFGVDDRMLNHLTGAFYRGSGTYATASSGTESTNPIAFSASRSNSIYGRSTTVQPPAIRVRVVARYK